MGKHVSVGEVKFGRLTAKYLVPNTNLWHCECDCGNNTTASSGQLRAGHKQSCGCLSYDSSLLGKRFGKLVAVKYKPGVRTRKSKGTSGGWECVCDCGVVLFVKTSELKKSKRNCGGFSHRKHFLEIGSKIGYLLVIGVKEPYYVCRCICGEVVEKKASYLEDSKLKNHNSSCGCGKGLPEGEALVNKIFSSYKNAALQKGLEFSLTHDFFKKLLFENCFYCDAPPCTVYEAPRIKGSLIYNGIDRVVLAVAENPTKCYKSP